MSACREHATSTPIAPHDASAAQLVQGLRPLALNVLPSTQLSRQAISTVMEHAVFTPLPPHVPSAVQAAHGVLPVFDQVVPVSQGSGDLHTVLLVAVQPTSTPFVQEDVSAHGLHGDRPSPLHVFPASHVVLHIASFVRVHAFSTPFAQLASDAHAAHGALPDADHVLPPSQSGAPLQTISLDGEHIDATP